MLACCLTCQARLDSWHLRFFGVGGMASAEPNDECEYDLTDMAPFVNGTLPSAIHGVLHLLTANDMKELDRIGNFNMDLSKMTSLTNLNAILLV